ncbi:hypothetical protein EIK76_11920 [Rheinheimera mesophila]|uniref:Flagellar FliJ protein n=1 Tax=Rheinheimera mesophila TaxID=1547515 RepID=A0A3P3QGE0_9GAMM|nr:hypothetical protein [Rheinheimera mesophila]RRJ20226.1 hypothetical protein EIK76_11920 [Rheinheimera mesophila]
MLKKYLEQQQANLKQMGQRQQQLNQQAANEERRLQLLTEHISGMERSYQMKSALGLQNLASMKTVLLDMQQQQQHKTQAAYAELQQQQQVCQKQVAYSKGIEAVIQHRELAAQQKQQKAEQQQADEIAMQLFQLRLKKPA